MQGWASHINNSGLSLGGTCTKDKQWTWSSKGLADFLAGTNIGYVPLILIFNGSLIQRLFLWGLVINLLIIFLWADGVFLLFCFDK